MLALLDVPPTAGCCLAPLPACVHCQVSDFGMAFVAAAPGVQQGVHGMLRTCMRTGDAARARGWVQSFRDRVGGA